MDLRAIRMTFSGLAEWQFGSRIGVGEEQEDGTFAEAVVYQRPH